MFLGIPSKKDYKNIKSELQQIQEKNLSPTVFWPPSGEAIPLFDFDNTDEIRTALNTVPELVGVMNYLKKSISLGNYANEKEQETELIKILNEPNPLNSKTEFLGNYIENLLAYGRCHIYFNKIGVNLKSLVIIPSDFVEIYVGDISHKQLRQATDLNEIIKHYEIKFNNNSIKIDPAEILTITYNSDFNIKNNYLKYKSPLKSLENALQVTPAMYNSMQNLMNNGGMKGFVSNKSTDSGSYIPIEPKDRKEIQKAFKNYGSKKGQFDIAFVNSDINYVPITSRIKDMMLPEQRKIIKEVIADVLNFDTVLLNNNDSSKYGVFYKEARKSLFTETISPIANNLTENISNKADEIVFLDFSHLDIFSEDEIQKVNKVNIESQYIINLNTAVKEERMTRENAINILILNGYDEQTAKKLIQ